VVILSVCLEESICRSGFCYLRQNIFHGRSLYDIDNIAFVVVIAAYAIVVVGTAGCLSILDSRVARLCLCPTGSSCVLWLTCLSSNLIGLLHNLHDKLLLPLNLLFYLTSEFRFSIASLSSSTSLHWLIIVVACTLSLS
jgi:hypothetical protein